MIIFANQLSVQLKAPFPHGFLVAGDDQILVQDTVDIIKTKLKQKDTAIKRINIETKADLAELTHLGKQNALFSQHTLYLIACKQWRLISTLLPKLLTEQCNPMNVMIFTGPGLNKTQASAKWVTNLPTSTPVVRVTPLRPQDLPGWIQAKCQQYHINLSRDIQQFLLEHACQNLAELEANIRQLSHLFDNHKPSLAEVKSVMVDGVSASPWDISQMLLERNINGLQNILRQCLINHDHLAVIATLGRDLERTLAIYTSQLSQKPPEGALKKLGVWPNQQAGYVQFSKQVIPKTVTYALHKISQAEVAFKTGQIPAASSFIQQAVFRLLSH